MTWSFSAQYQSFITNMRHFSFSDVGWCPALSIATKFRQPVSKTASTVFDIWEMIFAHGYVKCLLSLISVPFKLRPVVTRYTSIWFSCIFLVRRQELRTVVKRSLSRILRYNPLHRTIGCGGVQKVLLEFRSNCSQVIGCSQKFHGTGSVFFSKLHAVLGSIGRARDYAGILDLSRCPIARFTSRARCWNFSLTCAGSGPGSTRQSCCQFCCFQGLVLVVVEWSPSAVYILLAFGKPHVWVL